MLKKITLVLLCFVIELGQTIACEVCKRQQPEILRDLAHGPGPQGTSDYIITWTAGIIVGITLILSIKMLVFPNEQEINHIKNIPLQLNDY